MLLHRRWSRMMQGMLHHEGAIGIVHFRWWHDVLRWIHWLLRLLLLLLLLRLVKEPWIHPRCHLWRHGLLGRWHGRLLL